MADEIEYPVSNESYNLLSILTSKLEALAAYETYAEDLEGDALELLQQIEADDRRHIELLIPLVEGHIKTNGLRPKKRGR